MRHQITNGMDAAAADIIIVVVEAHPYMTSAVGGSPPQKTDTVA